MKEKCPVCGFAGKESGGICKRCLNAERVKNLTVDDLIERAAKQKRPLTIPPVFIESIKKYYERNKIQFPDLSKSLYIFGPNGIGKTCMAYSLALEQVRKDQLTGPKSHPIAVGASTLLNNLRKDQWTDRDRYEKAQQITAYGDDIVIPPSVLEIYQNSKWLLIDDLGPEKVTDWAFTQLYLILNYRYEWMMPTIITSNLTLDELKEKLGDARIPSRIQAMCEGFEVVDYDRRSKK